MTRYDRVDAVPGIADAVREEQDNIRRAVPLDVDATTNRMTEGAIESFRRRGMLPRIPDDHPDMQLVRSLLHRILDPIAEILCETDERRKDADSDADR